MEGGESLRSTWALEARWWEFPWVLLKETTKGARQTGCVPVGRWLVFRVSSQVWMLPQSHIWKGI